MRVGEGSEKAKQGKITAFKERKKEKRKQFLKNPKLCYS